MTRLRVINGEMSNPPMTWAMLIHGHQAWMKAAHHSPATRSLREAQLRTLAAVHRRPDKITADQLVEWIGSHRWAAETQRSYRCTLRGFFGWAHRHGHLPTDPSIDLPPIRTHQHPPRPTPDDVWRTAMLTAEPRVMLMIVLGARVGLRRAEIAGLRIEWLERDLVGWSLRVLGKGDKVRLVPVADEVAAAILRQAGDVREGWLFPSPARSRTGQPMTPAHVGKLVRQALGGPWTTHTLRHRYASVTYAAERDLLAVQDLLGHAKSETTRGYVRTPDGAMRRAAAAA